MTLRLMVSCFLTLCLAAPAFAQCTIGIFSDPAGTVSVDTMTPGVAKDFYVVLRTENLIDAVSYRLEIPSMFDPDTNPGGTIFRTGRWYGPSETGINIQTAGGDNIGLGECAIGFGGQSIRVERFTMLAPTNVPWWEEWYVRPNPDSSPLHPQLATCPGQVVDCEMTTFFLLFDVPTENVSFGQVKALY